MITQDELFYFNHVKLHMDKDGWFPDDILGQSFWVLSYCDKEWRGDQLMWKFVKHDELLNATSTPAPHSH